MHTVFRSQIQIGAVFIEKYFRFPGNVDSNTEKKKETFRARVIRTLNKVPLNRQTCFTCTVLSEPESFNEFTIT